jgi:hypothetical protein
MFDPPPETPLVPLDEAIRKTVLMAHKFYEEVDEGSMGNVCSREAAQE